MLLSRISALLILSLAAAQAAQAASSDWHNVEGGSIRIVTAGAPDAEGYIRGALQIDLAPGWKTYWMDPGASGVPPQISAALDGAPAEVEIGFPPPQRFDDGYTQWTGYDHSVSLALTMRVPKDASDRREFTANAFLGVCEMICIPVQAELSFSLEGNGNSAEDAQMVASAFAALPPSLEETMKLELIAREDDALIVEARLPDGMSALDLFLAGNEGLTLEVPEIETSTTGSSTRFRVPIAFSAPGAQAGDLAYTLLTSDGAYSGQLSLR